MVGRSVGRSVGVVTVQNPHLSPLGGSGRVGTMMDNGGKALSDLLLVKRWSGDITMVLNGLLRMT